jgi:hypothetical protein
MRLRQRGRKDNRGNGRQQSMHGVKPHSRQGISPRSLHTKRAKQGRSRPCTVVPWMSSNG